MLEPRRGEVIGTVALHLHPQNHSENKPPILSRHLPLRCLLVSSIGQTSGRQRAKESECYSPRRSTSQTQRREGQRLDLRDKMRSESSLPLQTLLPPRRSSIAWLTPLHPLRLSSRDTNTAEPCITHSLG